MAENDYNVEETKITQAKKRGRKPGSTTSDNKNYFGMEEEQAFQNYLLCTSKSERDKLFDSKLKPAFTKMIESIIRRYNLFTPYEDFDDTFNDTLSFLATKMANFKPGKGKKAYSYCGTICKNYLINKRQTTMKRDNKFLSYDVVYGETNPDNRTDTSTMNDGFNKGLITNVISNILSTIDNGYWDDGNKMTENEKKIGRAIIEILNNWEDIFKLGDTQKFNKTNVLYFIKEITMLTTKEVKDGLKKYRVGYYLLKDNFVNRF